MHIGVQINVFFKTLLKLDFPYKQIFDTSTVDTQWYLKWKNKYISF